MKLSILSRRAKKSIKQSENNNVNLETETKSSSLKKNKEFLFIGSGALFAFIGIILISHSLSMMSDIKQEKASISSAQESLSREHASFNALQQKIGKYFQIHHLKPAPIKISPEEAQNIVLNYYYLLPIEALKYNIILSRVSFPHVSTAKGTQLHFETFHKLNNVKKIEFTIEGKYNDLASLEKFINFYDKYTTLKGLKIEGNNFSIVQYIVS